MKIFNAHFNSYNVINIKDNKPYHITLIRKVIKGERQNKRLEKIILKILEKQIQKNLKLKLDLQQRIDDYDNLILITVKSHKLSDSDKKEMLATYQEQQLQLQKQLENIIIP